MRQHVNLAKDSEVNAAATEAAKGAVVGAAKVISPPLRFGLLYDGLLQIDAFSFISICTELGIFCFWGDFD